MRFMIIVKATKDSEAGVMPDAARLAQMTDYHAALAKAGALVDFNGLQASSAGWRIKYSGNKRSYLDGPFAGTRELIAGYTIINVQSLQEAIEWTRRFPNPAGAGKAAEIEVRPLLEMDEIGNSAAVERFREIHA